MFNFIIFFFFNFFFFFLSLSVFYNNIIISLCMLLSFFLFIYLLFCCVCYCHMWDPIPQVGCLTFLASLATDAYSWAPLGTLRLLLKDNFFAFFRQQRLVLYQASLWIEGLGIRHVRSNSCVKHIFRPVRSGAYHPILTCYVNLYD